MDVLGAGAEVVVLAIITGAVVALAGLAVLGWWIQRSRKRAEARLDDVSSRVLKLAVEVSDQVRADGYDARVRLLRAANEAMNEQRAARHQTRP